MHWVAAEVRDNLLAGAAALTSDDDQQAFGNWYNTIDLGRSWENPLTKLSGALPDCRNSMIRDFLDGLDPWTDQDLTR